MKHFRLITLVFSAVIAFILTLSATAAIRKSEFPITSGNNSHNITINSFHFTNITENNNQICLEYNIEVSNKKGIPVLYIISYDSKGIPIDRSILSYSVQNSQVYVPANTALYEIRDGYNAGESYFYNKYINVYKKDGSVKAVPGIQVSSAMKDGWLPPVKMYAEDGRTINVSPFKVEAFEKVGWHTAFSIVDFADYTYGKTIFLLEFESGLFAENDPVYCYSSNGNLISKDAILLTHYDDLCTCDFYVNVPNNTAMIYFPKSGYFYCKYATYRSKDERSLFSSNLLKLENEKVGWYRDVYMYAEDGRKIQVPIYQVDDYKAVGWSTQHPDYFEFSIMYYYNYYKENKEYYKIIRLVNNELPNFYGTKYEQKLYKMRTEAIDLWRNAINSPMVLDVLPSDSYMEIPDGSYNYYIYLNVCNLSYKNITSFEYTFECYDRNGVRRNKAYKCIYNFDSCLTPGQPKELTSEFNIFGQLYYFSDFRLTKVTFEDGTVWIP